MPFSLISTRRGTMQPATRERRSAAIMVADVAGYSRMMERDERQTLDALKLRLTRIVHPNVARCLGRIFKTTGDGFLAEFGGAADALECAVGIQKAMRRGNARIAADRRIEFRIGINVGEVIAEAGDIFGNAVNIAARMERAAEIGGICLSGSAYDQVKGEAALRFADGGPVRAKNISGPLRAFHVRLPGRRPESAADHPRHGWPTLPSKPSIAVLPLTDLDRPDADAYFSDGVTADIITELSRFRTLFVVARATTFAFRGPNVDLRRLGHELGVQYALLGTVRRRGTAIRITVELVRCADGVHVWGERYDCRAEEIFAVQDEVVGEIVGRLEIALVEDRVSDAARLPPRSLTAYDSFLRAAKLMERWTEAADAEAVTLLESAVALDPGFARAYASLAAIHNSRHFLRPGLLSHEADRATAFAHARRAVALDPNDARNHLDLAWSHALARDFAMAEKHFEMAGRLNPNDANIMISQAQALAYLGDAGRGLVLARAAIRRNPLHPDYYLGYLASIYFLHGAYEEAAAAVELAPAALPEVAAWRAAACGLLARGGEARAATRRFLADVRGRWVGTAPPDAGAVLDWLRQIVPLRRPEDEARLLEGLQAGGLPALRPQTRVA
jgi:TolB-like protein/class 3 adenylate cyclase/Flp pilus assembly protein TadD